MKREEWQENFSEWFNGAISQADIMDIQYPVKGLYVWKPYGFKLRNNTTEIIKNLLEDAGHEEVLFPLLIPRNIFQKEGEHIRGFEDEAYWVTHGGKKELNVDLALRPTSETSIYPMLERWVRSHNDLPLKIYQIVNIFRHETKMTKPLIRLREVTTFKEAHTAHTSKENAEKQVEKAIEIYKKFFDELGVPYTITRRPPWDTFAGADYSIAFDTLAPDGRTLQIGTVHLLGQNFAKVFDVSFETVDGDQEYVYQTSYGISDRAIASIIMVHGDDRGLCLPPKLAPIQVVIVPIPYKEDDVDVHSFAEEVKEKLEDNDIRTELDKRDLRPGDKYYRWERRGVPLRIEIGPREVKENKITFVRRDTGDKEEASLDDLASQTEEMFQNIFEDMKDRAESFQEDRIFWTEEIEEAKKILEKREGIVKIPWCGKESCGSKIEDRTGSDVLGREIDGGDKTGKCPICGKENVEPVLLSQTY